MKYELNERQTSLATALSQYYRSPEATNQAHTKLRCLDIEHSVSEQHATITTALESTPSDVNIEPTTIDSNEGEQTHDFHVVHTTPALSSQVFIAICSQQESDIHQLLARLDAQSEVDDSLTTGHFGPITESSLIDTGWHGFFLVPVNKWLQGFPKLLTVEQEQYRCSLVVLINAAELAFAKSNGNRALYQRLRDKRTLVYYANIMSASSLGRTYQNKQFAKFQSTKRLSSAKEIEATQVKAPNLEQAQITAQITTEQGSETKTGAQSAEEQTDEKNSLTSVLHNQEHTQNGPSHVDYARRHSNLVAAYRRANPQTTELEKNQGRLTAKHTAQIQQPKLPSPESTTKTADTEADLEKAAPTHEHPTTDNNKINHAQQTKTQAITQEYLLKSKATATHAQPQGFFRHFNPFKRFKRININTRARAFTRPNGNLIEREAQQNEAQAQITQTDEIAAHRQTLEKHFKLPKIPLKIRVIGETIFGVTAMLFGFLFAIVLVREGSNQLALIPFMFSVAGFLVLREAYFCSKQLGTQARSQAPDQQG